MVIANRHRNALETLGRAFNLDGWRKALQGILQEGIETVPKGWISSDNFAKEMGYSSVHARHKLRLLYNSGRAERKRFKVQTGDVVRSIWHYRLKK